jgi:hypothetical protein
MKFTPGWSALFVDMVVLEVAGVDDGEDGEDGEDGSGGGGGDDEDANGESRIVRIFLFGRLDEISIQLED